MKQIVTNAKLYVCGIERELYTVSLEYERNTSNSGRPADEYIGGYIELSFPSQASDDVLLEWIIAMRLDDDSLTYPFNIYVLKNGKIVFYEDAACTIPLFIYKFSDATLVNYKEVFNSQTGMVTSLKISAAIEEYKSIFRVKLWNENFIPPVINGKPNKAFHKKKTKEVLKFVTEFRRLENYQGEFGFDWLRDSYKNICENYEELKKEYPLVKIHQKDYFIPWLSMFPNQDNVKLNLKIDVLSGIVTDSDIIKLPTKNGISFKPNEIKVSEANTKEIQVLCESPIMNDTTISLLDKDNNVVGKLNVFKNVNHKELHFNITPVRILRQQSKEKDKNIIEKRVDIKETVKNSDGTSRKVRGWGDKGKDLTTDLKNLEKYLNKHSLNQALLQCTIGKVYDIVIDEDKWIENDLIINEGCVFKGNLLDIFSQELKKQHPKQAKKRGIIMFLSSLDHANKKGKKGAGGYADLRNIDSKNLAIFRTNLWHKESFVHEISHVAGLEHSFKENRNYNIEDLAIDNKYLKQVDDYLDYMVKNGFSKKEIADFWKKHKKDYKLRRSSLNIYYRNLHKFKKGKTENIMDYNNNKKSFWKFQWISLQDDIIKFYNTKK